MAQNMASVIAQSNSSMVQAALEAEGYGAGSPAVVRGIGQVRWKEDGCMVDNIAIVAGGGAFQFVARDGGGVIRWDGGERGNSCFIVSLAAALHPGTSDANINLQSCHLYRELVDAAAAAAKGIASLPPGPWRSSLLQATHNLQKPHLLSAFLPLLFPTNTLKDRCIVLFRVRQGERAFDRVVIMKPAGGRGYVGEPLCILVDEERSHAQALVGAAGQAKVLLHNYLVPWASLDPLLVRIYDMGGWQGVEESQVEAFHLPLPRDDRCVSCGDILGSP